MAAKEFKIPPKLDANERARIQALAPKDWQKELSNYIESLISLSKSIHTLTRKVYATPPSGSLKFTVPTADPVTGVVTQYDHYITRGVVNHWQSEFGKALKRLKPLVRMRKKKRGPANPAEFKNVHKRHVAGDPFRQFLAGTAIGSLNASLAQGPLANALPEAAQGRLMKSLAAGLLYIAGFNDLERRIQAGDYPIPDPAAYAGQVQVMPIADVQNQLAFYDGSYIQPVDPAWAAAFGGAIPAVYVWQELGGGVWRKARNPAGGMTVFQAIQNRDPEFNPARFKLFQFQRIIAASLYDDADAQAEAAADYAALQTNAAALLNEYHIGVQTRDAWKVAREPTRKIVKKARILLKAREKQLMGK